MRKGNDVTVVVSFKTLTCYGIGSESDDYDPGHSHDATRHPRRCFRFRAFWALNVLVQDCGR
ncbi:hypothetical protein DPMN_020380 [Dreissena polymorpha]|uniref:Uncharacterized protein n=1 Tax=Dreissena polymorpha TaxID=45954 RepID=A0A9D4SB01_DREPO|nr:hypothetical protein DPMN_020380 [Dreissena polymorpha]